MSRILLSCLALLSLLPPALQAAEPVDLDMITRIRNEGLHHSQVMATLSHLTDVIGPRLTGSPGLRQANDWTRDQLTEWGLANAHLEGWEFGRGWSFSRSAVHMISPRATPLLAEPLAWTPGTNGPVRGEVVYLPIKRGDNPADLFADQKGKLEGKILLIEELDPPTFGDEPTLQRLSDEDLDDLEHFEIPSEDEEGNRPERFRQRLRQREEVRRILEEEKVLAIVTASSRGDGILRAGIYGSFRSGEPYGVPGLVMAAEHYRWLVRLIEQKQPVELEIDVTATFHEDDTKAYNTVAELPGSDKAQELVLAGAHLDSWHLGTGATDNGAGCAVMMEALRILKAVGAKPRRTIGIALWSGEEQGLGGAYAYATEHLVEPPKAENAEDRVWLSTLRGYRGPLTFRAGYPRFVAYFNLDNGAGRIRGIYSEENAAIAPIFQDWLRPLNDLGADTVTLRTTGSTDHVVFDRIGLPAFQFIQDPLEYSTLTHHSNLDVLDEVPAEDLKQAAVVVATMLYHAAMRDQPLPRKPLPVDEEGRQLPNVR